MITFKQFLIEKRMSGSAYAQTLKRLEHEAKIGFEIEVFVPTDSFYHREPDQNPAKKLHLDQIKTWDDFEIYFDVSRAHEREIMSEYEKWVVQKEDEWVDDNWRDYADDDDSPNEKEARRKALKATKDNFTWEMWWGTWFKEKFENTKDFILQYELEPSHGWADDEHINQHHPLSSGYHSGWKNTAAVMAEYLGRALKSAVRVNAVGYETWNLVHDTSIKDKNGLDNEHGQDGVGMEIISPPLPPMKAIDQLTTVLKLLDQHEIETNGSTGIHVNISLPNLKDFDPLKLVLFMGDKHILEKFDRSSNSYTRSQLQQVIDSISLSGKIPRSAKDLMALGREGLAETGKYFSVNLKHLPKYLEFRAAGGQDYHKRIFDIKEVIGRWLTAVEIAADPDSHRREYLKKVMALIDKAPGTKDTLDDLSIQQWYKKKNLALAQFFELAGTDSEKNVAMRSLLYFLGSDEAVMKGVPFSWLKEMRALFRNLGITYDSVLEITRNQEMLTAVQAAGRAFRLVK